MLVLSRKKGESVVVNGNITIVVVDVRGDKARIGIEAPADVPVYRSEVLAKKTPSENGKEAKQNEPTQGETTGKIFWEKAERVDYTCLRKGRANNGKRAKTTDSRRGEKKDGSQDDAVETLYLSKSNEAYRADDNAETGDVRDGIRTFWTVGKNDWALEATDDE
ncbi:MAG: carbon storage regulator [Thermoguttaceae bacterium]|nr:carbon storage regulator [Thermoguttaceae bacterium]